VTTVEEVVRQVFGAEPGTIDASSSPESVEGWDSMGHLNLISALETRFNVSIDIGDAMEMVSVQRIREILLDYGVQS
jgi:acyl carrier protein